MQTSHQTAVLVQPAETPKPGMNEKVIMTDSIGMILTKANGEQIVINPHIPILFQKTS